MLMGAKKWTGAMSEKIQQKLSRISCVLTEKNPNPTISKQKMRSNLIFFQRECLLIPKIGLTRNNNGELLDTLQFFLSKPKT